MLSYRKKFVVSMSLSTMPPVFVLEDLVKIKNSIWYDMGEIYFKTTVAFVSGWCELL